MSSAWSDDLWIWSEHNRHDNRIELPQSYFQAPDPYHDAPSNGVSLLALSKYAMLKNKRIIDLNCKEINDCCGKAKQGGEKLWREYKKSDDK